MKETLIERVQEFIDRANKLRMKSVAIPVSDLEQLLRLCNGEPTDRLAVLGANGRPESGQGHPMDKLAKRLRTLWR